MSFLTDAAQLAIVVLGFGLLIVIHELGHFLAARWAGIRVLAFAVGFGKCLVSYRKGMGWRRGSTEPTYAALAAQGLAANLSPTEYRFNALPFGGYVKMLGQVDGDPTQTSNEPDSYQRAPVWKRMVVISAGVVANLITAAVLFMAVFKFGLLTEPAVIGQVAPKSPAARAALVSGDPAGQPGLRPGDAVTSVNGSAPRTFNDVVMAVAMAPKSAPVRLAVERPGVGPLEFELRPEPGAQSRLLEIGVAPPSGTAIYNARTPDERAALARLLAEAGVPNAEPGMTLVRAGSLTKITGAYALTEAARASAGAPFPVAFRTAAGQEITAELRPRAALQSDLTPLPGETAPTPIAHLLGLTPVLAVAPATDPAQDRQGLKDHDIFARVGSIEYPSIPDGIAEIRRHKGKRIPVTVLRLQPDGSRQLVALDPPPLVKPEGKGVIGFTPEDTRDQGTYLAAPPRVLATPRTPLAQAAPTPAAALNIAPGSRVVAVGGAPVADFTTLREALRAAAERSRTVTLTLAPPRSTEPRAHAEPADLAWTLTDADLATLRELPWVSPISESLFEPEMFKLKAEGPLGAIAMGAAETRRVMLMTYLTFARLYDGTVKVEHLKGPVGIAHIGTRIVDRGLVWLLFFLALISVNLAVINFLPLPVVDGGQFLFLCVEALRGRPAPIAVQNIATFVGLLIIGVMFVIVTANDIVGLFG